MPRPGRFTPGKYIWYPLYRKLGVPQGRSGRVRKILLPPTVDLRTVQPVASRYTDCDMTFNDFTRNYYCNAKAAEEHHIYLRHYYKFLAAGGCVLGVCRSAFLAEVRCSDRVTELPHLASPLTAEFRGI